MQKTAYEMRISDWSSDLCSSDLRAWVLRPLWHGANSRVAVAGLVAGLSLLALSLYALVGTPLALDPVARQAPATIDDAIAQLEAQLAREPQAVEEIGRASCRERVCQYV